jgi:hypothetical protein
MRGIAIAVCAALVAGGCGSEEKRVAAATATPTATATPEGRFPVAYRVPIPVVRKLDEGDAGKLIREEGELIARSDYDTITNYVLAEWLQKRGIEVEDPGVLGPTVSNVYDEQSRYLMIISQDPKVADALDELRPSKRRLAAFYNNYGGAEQEPYAQAGEAMLDRLRIFRIAARAGDERHVVILPEIY